jgi:hypothetical protein
MKHKLLYLLLFLAVAAAGCLKTQKAADPVPIPSGTFAGQFKVFHRHTNQVPFDSTKTNLIVKLTASDYTYTVTGDTSTLHAGSNGTYAGNATAMLFTDKTYSASSPFTKWHLSGLYNYSYDGTNLTIYYSSSDTLVLGYALKKQL